MSACREENGNSSYDHFLRVDLILMGGCFDLRDFVPDGRMNIFPTHEWFLAASI